MLLLPNTTHALLVLCYQAGEEHRTPFARLQFFARHGEGTDVQMSAISTTAFSDVWEACRSCRAQCSAPLTFWRTLSLMPQEHRTAEAAWHTHHVLQASQQSTQLLRGEPLCCLSLRCGGWKCTGRKKLFCSFAKHTMKRVVNRELKG